MFQLAAPQGGQILRSPVQLASFAAHPEAEPKVQFAVAESGPAAAGAMPPAAGTLPPAAGSAPIQAGNGARLVRTSFGDTAAPAAAQETPPADPVEPQGGTD